VNLAADRIGLPRLRSPNHLHALSRLRHLPTPPTGRSGQSESRRQVNVFIENSHQRTSTATSMNALDGHNKRQIDIRASNRNNMNVCELMLPGRSQQIAVRDDPLQAVNPR